MVNPRAEAKCDALTVSFDHLIGLDHEERRKSNAKLLGRLEIYDKLELRGLFDGQVGRFLPLKNLINRGPRGGRFRAGRAHKT